MIEVIIFSDKDDFAKNKMSLSIVKDRQVMFKGKVPENIVFCNNNLLFKFIQKKIFHYLENETAAILKIFPFVPGLI